MLLSENNSEQAEEGEDPSLQSHLFSSQREARALRLGRTLSQNPQEKCLFAFISSSALSCSRAPWHGCVATGYNLYPAEIKLTLVVFASKGYSSGVSQLRDSCLRLLTSTFNHIVVQNFLCNRVWLFPDTCMLLPSAFFCLQIKLNKIFFKKNHEL